MSGEWGRIGQKDLQGRCRGQLVQKLPAIAARRCGNGELLHPVSPHEIACAVAACSHAP